MPPPTIAMSMARLLPNALLSSALAGTRASSMSFDPEAVRAFEHAGWQEAAAEYEATFAQATAPFVEALLDAAGTGAGMKLLDVCCGTGIVTAAAAARGASVVGIDFSPAMLRLCRDAGFANIRAEPVRREWQVADPRDLLATLSRGTVRTAALIGAQPAEARPAIEAAIVRAAAPYRRGDGFAVPIVAILASGTKSSA